MRKEQSITIRIEPELLEAVKAAAKNQDRSVGSFIRQLLVRHFMAVNAA